MLKKIITLILALCLLFPFSIASALSTANPLTLYLSNYGEGEWVIECGSEDIVSVDTYSFPSDEEEVGPIPGEEVYVFEFSGVSSGTEYVILKLMHGRSVYLYLDLMIQVDNSNFPHQIPPKP